MTQRIKDKPMSLRFLAGPQLQPLLQHAHSEISLVPNDHSELSLERPQDGLESEYEPFLSLDQVGRTLAPQRLPSRLWGFVE